MSRQNRSTIVLLALVVFGALMSALAQDDQSQPVNKPVLNYFWKRAGAMMTTGNPDERGLKYSYVATTYYKRIGKLGAVEWTDSLRTAYYHSFGNLDSTKTRLAPRREGIPEVQFDYPNVFGQSYYLNDFPNDTGGQYVAIGFDTDTSHMSLPTGLALIDRQVYFPRWLYLHYEHKDGFRRFTRSFRFAVQEGYVFPDSVWEVATSEGLFFQTSYRLETRIDSVTVYR